MKRNRVWLTGLVFSLAGLSACLVQPEPAVCSEKISSCDSCLDEEGCGWCRDGDRCLRGDSFGPATAGACSASKWRFQECEIGGSDACDAESCSSCKYRDNCGWCNSTSTCMAGTSTGPSDGGICEGWAWLYDTCDGTDCGSRTSCRDCGYEDGCGWCHATNTCIQGGSSGPSQSGSCPAGGDWSTSSQQCDAVTCASLTTCASCDGNSVYCTWCRDSSSSAGYCSKGCSGQHLYDCTGGSWY